MLVTDEEAKQRILAAIADQYSRKILTITRDQPMSAMTLSKTYAIPNTTVYRRIVELVHAGLLAAVRSDRTSDGKWYELYRSLLSRIHVSLENGNIRVEVEITRNIADKFTKMWLSIPSNNQIGSLST